MQATLWAPPPVEQTQSKPPLLTLSAPLPPCSSSPPPSLAYSAMPPSSEAAQSMSTFQEVTLPSSIPLSSLATTQPLPNPPCSATAEISSAISGPLSEHATGTSNARVPAMTYTTTGLQVGDTEAMHSNWLMHVPVTYKGRIKIFDQRFKPCSRADKQTVDEGW